MNFYFTKNKLEKNFPKSFLKNKNLLEKLSKKLNEKN